VTVLDQSTDIPPTDITTLAIFPTSHLYLGSELPTAVRSVTKTSLTFLTSIAAELPLLFGTHYEYRGNSTEYEWQVAEGMQSKLLALSGRYSTDTLSDRSLAILRSEPKEESARRQGSYMASLQTREEEHGGFCGNG
jgi:hypothetical protein